MAVYNFHGSIQELHIHPSVEVPKGFKKKNPSTLGRVTSLHLFLNVTCYSCLALFDSCIANPGLLNYEKCCLRMSAGPLNISNQENGKWLDAQSLSARGIRPCYTASCQGWFFSTEAKHEQEDNQEKEDNEEKEDAEEDAEEKQQDMEAEPAASLQPAVQMIMIMMQHASSFHGLSEKCVVKLLATCRWHRTLASLAAGAPLIRISSLLWHMVHQGVETSRQPCQFLCRSCQLLRSQMRFLRPQGSKRKADAADDPNLVIVTAYGTPGCRNVKTAMSTLALVMSALVQPYEVAPAAEFQEQGFEAHACGRVHLATVLNICLLPGRARLEAKTWTCIFAEAS